MTDLQHVFIPLVVRAQPAKGEQAMRYVAHSSWNEPSLPSAPLSFFAPFPARCTHITYLYIYRRVIRPMLNERTQAKIGIINTDKKKIAEALLECIAPENLPRQYGGTCPLDLGESEQEVDLRAYVSSITPSLAPLPTHHDDNDDDDDALDLEVEVDLHAAPAVAAGSRADGGPVGAAEDRAGDGISSASPPHGGGDARGEEDRKSGERISRPGAARRALGTVTGALTWAGGKFSWQRSPIAHLGDENGFEYDPDLQRWVLRDGKEKGAAGGRRTSGGGGGDRSGSARASGGGDGRKERGGSRGHPSSSRRPVRSGSMGSSTSEEMTVLAIQVCWCVLFRRFFGGGRGGCVAGFVLWPLQKSIPL